MTAEQHDMATTDREVALLTAAAALLVAQQVASKATRDALLLASFDPAVLPALVAVSSVASLGAVGGMGWMLASRGPQNVVPLALIANASLYGGEWLGHRSQPQAVAIAMYLHVAALGAVLISGFWSLVRERADPHRAKRVVARVTAGATFGGIVGGLATLAISQVSNPATMFLVLAVANVAVAVLVRAVPSSPVRKATEVAASAASVGRSHYLRSIALFAASIATGETLLEFAFNAAAASQFTETGSLAAFFASFYTITNTLTFGVQAVVGRGFLRRFGLGPAIASMPLAMSVGWLFLAGAPFAAIVMLRGGAMALSNSIQRAGYEILFVPLPSSISRATKTWIDVAGARLGDLTGAGAITALLVFVPPTSTAIFLAAAAVSVVPLVLVRSLTAGYVHALRSALSSGSVDLGEPTSLDATTRATLDGAGALDRGRVLRAIEERRLAEAGRSDAETEAGDAASRFEALVKGDTGAARGALRVALTPELVRAAVLRVADPELADETLHALRRAAPRAIGTLADALLDPALPLEVRTKLPPVLRRAGSPRAVAALTEALGDASLEMRLEVARTLSRIARDEPRLAPQREVVLDACMRELADHGVAWSDTVLVPTKEPPHSLDELLRARASRSLELVLTLLSSILDGESMRLATSGLAAEDPNTRATAIELLENVVPSPLREPLVSAIVGDRPRIPSRSRNDIVQDLLRSQAAHARNNE